MRFTAGLLAAIAVLVCEPAAAINKCTGADGRVVFQDAPCSGKGEQLDVRPATGSAAKAQTAMPAGGGASSSEAQRLEGLIATSQRQRRAQDLRERLLPNAEEARNSHRAGCAQRQKDLAAQQYAYQQNLYGKTHAAQIASEMAASAASCETRDRELKESLDALVNECTALRCRG